MSVPDPSDPVDQPTAYMIRYSESATREIEQILIRINDFSGSDQAALEWLQGLYRIVGGLARNPRRFAIQESESRKLGGEVRREIYRTAGSGTGNTGYYIFYRVLDTPEDGPRVGIVHVRHTSRKPITRAEAKDIRAGQ